MSQFNNTSWQNATNQLNFAEQTIIQCQKKMTTTGNDAQQQLWLQQALGALCRAKDVIGSSMK
jgi:hypothetical protein